MANGIVKDGEKQYKTPYFATLFAVNWKSVENIADQRFSGYAK